MTIIGFCGLNCENCEARIATIKNDNELREEVAKKWSELNGVEITKDMINCVGCREKGVKTPFCEYLCDIKKCASISKFETCASCKNVNSCDKLYKITSNSKEAKNNLESLSKTKASS